MEQGIVVWNFEYPLKIVQKCVRLSFGSLVNPVLLVITMDSTQMVVDFVIILSIVDLVQRVNNLYQSIYSRLLIASLPWNFYGIMYLLTRFSLLRPRWLLSIIRAFFRLLRIYELIIEQHNQLQ